MSLINSTHRCHGHIAVFAFPFGTHAAPLLSLVRRMAAAAPDAVFSFFCTAQSNKSLFSGFEQDHSCNNVRPYDVPEGLPEGYVFGGNPQEPVDKFLDAAPDSFRSVVAAAEEDTGSKISCFLADAFFWFAADMAEEMNVPWVALWTAGPRAVLVHADADIICQNMGPDVQEDTILNFVPGFSAIPAGDILEMVRHNPKSTFSTTLHKMGHALPRAAAVAINSFEEMDPEITTILKSKFKEFLSVGPFALTSPPRQADPHGCLEWLDGHEAASVAYISFGSVTSPPPHELNAIAEALKETGTPFLWSMRGNVEAQLPRGFVEEYSGKRGKIVGWAPQQQVLAHVAVGTFVTHCGWNSVLESVIGGVPMICRAFFGDQKLNTRTVQDAWGVGLGVEGGRFTTTGTTGALRRVLCSEEGEKMREKIKCLKEVAFKAVESDGTGSSAINFKRLVAVVVTV